MEQGNKSPFFLTVTAKLSQCCGVRRKVLALWFFHINLANIGQEIWFSDNIEAPNCKCVAKLRSFSASTQEKFGSNPWSRHKSYLQLRLTSAATRECLAINSINKFLRALNRVSFKTRSSELIPENCPWQPLCVVSRLLSRPPPELKLHNAQYHPV